MVENVLKVISVEEIKTLNNFTGKIIEFQEEYKNRKMIKNGKIGLRILWDKKKNLLIQNNETGNLTLENWKADPLFDDIKINDIVEGEIKNYKNPFEDNFNCAILDNERNDLIVATRQYFYLTGNNKLIDTNGETFTYISSIKIIR